MYRRPRSPRRGARSRRRARRRDRWRPRRPCPAADLRSSGPCGSRRATRSWWSTGPRARRSSARRLVRVAGKRRLIKRFAVPSLAAGGSRQVKVSASVPTTLPAGSFPLELGADARQRVSERSEANNCRRVGTFVVRGAPVAGTTPRPPRRPLPCRPSSRRPRGRPRHRRSGRSPDVHSRHAIHVTNATADYGSSPLRATTRRTPRRADLVGMHGCGDTAQNYLDWAVRPFAIRGDDGSRASTRRRRVPSRPSSQRAHPRRHGASAGDREHRLAAPQARRPQAGSSSISPATWPTSRPRRLAPSVELPLKGESRDAGDCRVAIEGRRAAHRSAEHVAKPRARAEPAQLRAEARAV